MLVYSVRSDGQIQTMTAPDVAVARKPAFIGDPSGLREAERVTSQPERSAAEPAPD